MKKYSDLQVTNLTLSIDIDVETIGNPDYTITVNDCVVFNTRINLPLLDPIKIEIQLQNKIYTTEYETAIILRQISIDDINIIPNYTHYAVYTNDHNFKDNTNYLGFNGKWTLTIDRPFYQWLHQAQNQGWLLN